MTGATLVGWRQKSTAERSFGMARLCGMIQAVYESDSTGQRGNIDHSGVPCQLCMLHPLAARPARTKGQGGCEQPSVIGGIAGCLRYDQE